MLAAEDHEHFGAIAHFLPYGVSAGDMRDEAALPAALREEFERQMVCIQTFRAVDHQSTQRMPAYEAQQFFAACLVEMRGQIHRTSSDFQRPGKWLRQAAHRTSITLIRSTLSRRM